MSHVQIPPPGGSGAAQAYRTTAISRSILGLLPSLPFHMLLSLLGVPTSLQAASSLGRLVLYLLSSQVYNPLLISVSFMLRIIEKPI